MAGKVLLHDVHVTEDDYTVTVLHAGSSVPKKFEKYVTNPKAFAPEESETTSTAASEVVDFAKLDGPALKAELKDRGLPVSGNKKALVQRLVEHEAEKQAADTEGDEESYEGLELEELQALLTKRELPTDGDQEELIERLKEDDAEREGDEETDE